MRVLVLAMRIFRKSSTTSKLSAPSGSRSALPLVYIDTCAFVAAFEADGDEGGLIRRLFAWLSEKPGSAVTSELTIAELLAPTARPNVMSIDERREVYLPLLENRQFIDFVPVTRAILIETVALRSAHPQKLPDAIHIATAAVELCGFFFSSDQDPRRVPQTLRWATPDDDGLNAIRSALDA